MTTAPHVFDKMKQDANVWLHAVEERLGTEDPQAAWHAVRGVFFAIRDRIPADEVFDLSAQLPTVLRGVFFEGYSPGGRPETYGREEFLARVQNELATVGHLEAEEATRAVAAVLALQISGGELKHVINLLPDDVKPLVRAA